MNTNNPGKSKIRVAVIYGGRSGEHEISLRIAASVIRFLDRDKFEVVPISIDKAGYWHVNDLSLIQNAGDSLPVFKDSPTYILPSNPHPGGTNLVQVSGTSLTQGNHHDSNAFDVAFPIMHGPLCEDGSIQGMLEMADIPYVGNGVLSSAVGMDKDVSKRLARDSGIPIVPYVCVKSGQWNKDSNYYISKIERELGYPVFVKPANLGSSVGVHKVKERSKLSDALSDAFKYDGKVLIERAVLAREIELAVLENSQAGAPPLVSVPGEVAPTHEFYSYEAKYLDENGAALLIPSPLTPQQLSIAQKMASDVFQALECEGLARVDLFLDKQSGEFYFNEINTIPGFTSISMYPKMWEASGIAYSDLLTKLINLALSRHERRTSLIRDYSGK